MKNILLVCSAGMSTSLLVSKMEEAAKKIGFECNIRATAESEVKNNIENIDVLLIGPQVRFLLSKFKTMLSEKDIPVEVINTIDYGTMNGEKVLNRACELMEGK